MECIVPTLLLLCYFSSLGNWPIEAPGCPFFVLSVSAAAGLFFFFKSESTFQVSSLFCFPEFSFVCTFCCGTHMCQHELIVWSFCLVDLGRKNEKRREQRWERENLIKAESAWEIKERDMMRGCVVKFDVHHVWVKRETC